jgi:hypothetical protein
MAGGVTLRGSLSDMTRRRRLLAVVGAASLIYLAALAYYAMVRSIDTDEGYYVSAARLVWEGKVPYRDFFFPQAPMLAYLYGWIWGVHPGSLVSMRLLSAGLTAATALLWGVCLVFSERLPRVVVVATFLAIVLNPTLAAWNVAVKTYAAGNLLASVAMISLYAALRMRRVRWYFIAGLALGLCASVRSLYGPLIAAVSLWMLMQNGDAMRDRILRVLAFLGGAGAGLFPLLRSLVSDPPGFLFNNLRYHRLDAGYIPLANGQIMEGYISVGHTLWIYFSWIFIWLITFHPYFTVNVILAMVGWRSLKKLRGSHAGIYTPEEYSYFRLAFVMAATYTATALTVFPPFDQYFESPLLPLLIPFLAEGLRVVLVSKKNWAIALALIVPLAFRFELSVDAIVGPAGPYPLSSFREVSGAIRAHSAPDDVVLSFWPGYVFESGRRYFPGMEDQFAIRMMNKLSPAEKARFHIPSNDDLMKAIRGREVRLVVVHPWIEEYYHNLTPQQTEDFKTTLDENYLPVARVGEVSVYQARPAASGGASPDHR